MYRLNTKITKRQAQALATKNKIYKSAISIMEKKYYNNVTIKEISKAAGVSVGSFYHYFNSKSDIFFEIYKQGDDYFQNVVSKQLTEEQALNKVIEFFKYYARYYQSTGIETTKILYNPKNKWFMQKGRFMQVLLQEIILAHVNDFVYSLILGKNYICLCL